MQALINFLARFINATKDAFNVQLSGSKLAEQQTEADAVAGVLTFTTGNFGTIEIYNTDAVNAGVFAVNGININVPPAKTFKASVGGVAGATVTITGATTYIVSRYE